MYIVCIMNLSSDLQIYTFHSLIIASKAETDNFSHHCTRHKHPPFDTLKNN